ncbi:MAG: serine protein kinase RIO [Cellvibrionaceae bacterium]
MKIPKRLKPLIEEGLIDEVQSQLMSGKEADIFIVRSHGEVRCAKVYKDAVTRSFKKAALYHEGRKTRGGRSARAMTKRSRYGREQQEDVWQTAEVDALVRLLKAGVRVPATYGCVDGVLLMDLVKDDEGYAAPRLNDVILTVDQALEDHAVMMEYIKMMLCAGIVHGDLSEFNVLLDEYGPVIIDLPQAVNASANNNAQSMLARDVNNMRDYYSAFAPEIKKTRYAEEIWSLYEEGKLRPDTILTGLYEDSDVLADVDAVVEEIKAIEKEEQDRIDRLSEL